MMLQHTTLTYTLDALIAEVYQFGVCVLSFFFGLLSVNWDRVLEVMKNLWRWTVKYLDVVDTLIIEIMTFFFYQCIGGIMKIFRFFRYIFVFISVSVNNLGWAKLLKYCRICFKYYYLNTCQIANKFAYSSAIRLIWHLL